MAAIASCCYQNSSTAIISTIVVRQPIDRKTWSETPLCEKQVFSVHIIPIAGSSFRIAKNQHVRDKAATARYVSLTAIRCSASA
ncbi:hypothetical protein IFT67_19895 [Sphingomonas sp. CFBP 13728]|uniref:hypothetical protein n=1 Tax=Sphingomonas sp. CFBP 13728 TaxID=2775294 RepID=UPI0017851E46|nr:hypothetical protein [Sphingomonas sp. CFBP 13728]MBD8621175.1 hypothetical protein [Sphingomonas sp. CFBP 13728]